MFLESDRRNTMQSSIRSHFESAAANSLLLVLPAFFLIRAEQFQIVIILFGMLFYYLSVHDSSVITAGLILCLFLIPCGIPNPDMREGIVTEVHASYIVVQKKLSRIIVYTDAMPVPDSAVQFDGDPEDLTQGKGFFRFPFAAYCHRKGIDYAVHAEHLYTIRPSHSLRGLLMTRILSDLDCARKQYLLETLFHIQSDETAFTGMLKESGISLSGVIVLFDLILKYVCVETTRKKIRFIATLLLALIFHMPFLLLYRCISMVLSYMGLSGNSRTGIAFLISLRIVPSAAYSASFMIPLLYSFAGRNRKNRGERMLLGLHGSALIFHSVNPIELLLFRYLLPLRGLCWVFALLEAFFRVPLHPLVTTFDHCTSFLSYCTLPGTLLGFGLPFYLLCLLLLPKHRNQVYAKITLFLVFQMFGLFHPFAELTFINVGQGDSILIRSPFRSGDVLIDTGKPSQKNNVDTMLEAKGIRKLHTLLITHADQDHSGNLEFIRQQYKPAQVITNHHDPFRAGIYRFVDLNDLDTDDENESSIVSSLNMNGMSVLLMADSSSFTEEQILKHYPGLSADILKLSHHGSKTGSSDRFLTGVKPSLAVVSSGAYQIYHHPSPEVTKRLYEHRIPYLDTKEEGDITLLMFPGFNLLITASGKIAIIRV